jgi:hypothetical protein
VSELLCYAINKFGRVPLKPLKSVINDFYSSDDIFSAKDKLVEETDILNIDKWQKPARRRKDSITRTQNEIDDIFQVIVMLDESHNLQRLPTFVATDPDRMPSIKLTDGDLAMVLIKLNALSDTVAGLKDKLDVPHRCDLPGPTRTSDVVITKPVDRSNNGAHPTNLSASHLKVGRISGPAVRHADSADVSSFSPMPSDIGDTSDCDGFIYQQRRSKRKKANSPNTEALVNSDGDRTKNLYSTKDSAGAHPLGSVANPKLKPKSIIGNLQQSSLRASKSLILKKSVYHIGNIDCSYSVSDVEDYIRSLGVRILTCFELKSSSTSPSDNKAFRVCIVDDDRNKLCDCDNWAIGVSIRVWTHKPKKDGVSDATSASPDVPDVQMDTSAAAASADRAISKTVAVIP